MDVEYPDLIGLKKRLPIDVIRKCFADLRDSNLERFLDCTAIYGPIKDMFSAVDVHDQGKLIGKAIGLQTALNYLNHRDPNSFLPSVQVANRLKELEKGGNETE